METEWPDETFPNIEAHGKFGNCPVEDMEEEQAFKRSRNRWDGWIMHSASEQEHWAAIGKGGDNIKALCIN